MGHSAPVMGPPQSHRHWPAVVLATLLLLPPPRLCAGDISRSNSHGIRPLQHDFSSGGGKLLPVTSQCEPITIDACADLPYKETRFPNLVDNEEQREAETQLNTFAALIQAHELYDKLKFFLCSVHVPMCTDKVPQAIGPCRPLCEDVRRTTEPTLRHFGFTWPDSLNCTKFPAENNAETMCMVGPERPHSDNTQMAAPNNMGGVIVDNEFKSIYVYINRSGECLLDCDLNAPQPYSVRERDVAATIGLAFAVISCLMAIACCCVIVCRHQYLVLRCPDACLVPITLCVAVHAATALLSILYRSTLSCITYGPARLVVAAGLQHVPCTVIAVILYYFGTAARVWWLNMCAAWFATRALGWPAQGVYAKRAPMHAAAWGVPLVLVVTVLMAQAVDADPLTGVCFVGNQNSRNLMLFVAGREIVIGVAGLLAIFLGVSMRRNGCVTGTLCCFGTGPGGRHSKAPQLAAAAGPAPLHNPYYMQNRYCSSASASNGGSLLTSNNSTAVSSSVVPAAGDAQAGSRSFIGLLCALYLPIALVLTSTYLYEQAADERPYALLLLRLIADGLYGVIVQAWCVIAIVLASCKTAASAQTLAHVQTSVNGAAQAPARAAGAHGTAAHNDRQQPVGPSAAAQHQPLDVSQQRAPAACTLKSCTDCNPLLPRAPAPSAVAAHSPSQRLYLPNTPASSARYSSGSRVPYYLADTCGHQQQPLHQPYFNQL